MGSASRLLEGVARRLATDQPVSRRGLLSPASADEPSLVARQAADATRLEHDVYRAPQAARPASRDDLASMQAILARTAPTRTEMLGLIAALRSPDTNGRIGDAAFARIARIRKQLRVAHSEVASLERRSDVRARLLSFLSDADALVAILAALGRNPGRARVEVLRAQAEAIEKRASATYRTIAPALTPPGARVRP